MVKNGMNGYCSFFIFKNNNKELYLLFFFFALLSLYTNNITTKLKPKPV